jgi:hypothetical protein
MNFWQKDFERCPSSFLYIKRNKTDSSWLYFVWDDFDYFGKENEILRKFAADALKLKFNIKFTERSKKFVG